LINSDAQDFAPIGAIWYYSERYFDRGDISFFTAEVIKDTTIHDKACRMIYINGGPCGAFEQWTNFVYEDDSIVYFYVQAIDSFQILYDFGAKQGDFWNITFNAMDELTTVQATVDTVFNVNINGRSLIKQIIKYSRPNPDPLEYNYSGEVTEIIGDSHYLFNLYSLHIVCDGDMTDGLRCYEDPEFGFYSTGIAESCTYTYHWNAIEENMINKYDIRIFPNPTNGQLLIDFNFEKDATIEILDLLGRVIYSKSIASETQLNIEAYANGIYIAYLKYQNKILGPKKIIKY